MIKTLKIEFEGPDSVEVSGEYVKQFKNIDNFRLDENGDMIPFPKEINIKEALERLPVTTTSVLSTGKKYKDYTFDDLGKRLD